MIHTIAATPHQVSAEKRAAQSRGIEPALERAATSPDRAESDAEGQQLEGSQEPSDRQANAAFVST